MTRAKLFVIVFVGFNLFIAACLCIGCLITLENEFYHFFYALRFDAGARAAYIASLGMFTLVSQGIYGPGKEARLESAKLKKKERFSKVNRVKPWRFASVKDVRFKLRGE